MAMLLCTKKLHNILANLPVHFVRAIPELTLKWQLFLLSINGWQSSDDIFMRQLITAMTKFGDNQCSQIEL